MKAMLFAVHDSKTEAFMPPFVASTPGEAERNFRNACSDPESTLHKFPQDFNLYLVGSWNNQAGLVEATIPPVFICAAKPELREVSRA